MNTETEQTRNSDTPRESGMLTSILPLVLTIASTLTFAFVLIFLAATQNQFIIL